MPVKVILVAYLTITLLFSLLFRYGVYYSFDIDTGYLGPFLLFHSFAILVPGKVKVNNENSPL
jgi:hypothetical protein